MCVCMCVCVCVEGVGTTATCGSISGATTSNKLHEVFHFLHQEEQKVSVNQFFNECTGKQQAKLPSPPPDMGWLSLVVWINVAFTPH